MSDVAKDIKTIWSRLFDHKGFLAGEIQLNLQEFEQKRGDSEVDALFKLVEDITDIKDTEVDKFKQAIQQNLPQANGEVAETLSTCQKFVLLENKFKEDDLLDEPRQVRKADWDHFMDHITSSYSKINSAAETKQEELQRVYTDLEKKLFITTRYP